MPSALLQTVQPSLRPTVARRFTVAVGPGSDLRDRDLIILVGKGDQDAFRFLFARYAPHAMALAQRVVRQTNLAEEIVQEVFLSVWRSPDTYEASRGSVRAWIMTQVHHRAVDLVRREESQRRRAASLASERGSSAEVGDDDPADTVIAALGIPQEQATIQGALDALPGPQREVIELMYFSGMSQTKVAERLTIPLGTVKSRTLLGMRRLREALEGTQR